MKYLEGVRTKFAEFVARVRGPQEERFYVVMADGPELRWATFGVSGDKTLVLHSVGRETPRGFARTVPLAKESTPLVFVADPTRVIRISASLHVRRSALSGPVQAAELENFLGSQASQIFGRMRASAAGALGTTETDTLLVESRVSDFRVDGHQVVYPLGFRAKKIDALIHFVFVPRALHDLVRPFVARTARFHFTDPIYAQWSALNKAVKGPFGHVYLREADSHAFVQGSVKSEFVFTKTPLSWSSRAFTDAIAHEWGVSSTVAAGMFHGYLGSRFSPHIMRSLKDVMEPVRAALFLSIAKSRAGKVSYVDTTIPLPFSLPHRAHRMELRMPPFTRILSTTGFTAQFAEWPCAPHERFPLLAPFLEFYYDNMEDPMSHWLRRRLHWLGALRGAGASSTTRGEL